ncbi:hypothetical protein PUNSTDRAFT_141237 [Punctularia strigosozonata HHB-11173 SS5]|uniref:uncharacterized protein n=1 Tax=Punctularia strigosozonata (strain HHB-11173) TaxID=741275 RepID=UPI00044163C6|nr:uncharacterized protein PUNSTDRAFT_141237 [Punctularia strigosozonata HHB-11173 SS5]EIN12565.1 hypothetical protein PUNSTDRAFT_141237 [Punctularia strigosozonata HHB-11173 SS5]
MSYNNDNNDNNNSFGGQQGSGNSGSNYGQQDRFDNTQGSGLGFDNSGNGPTGNLQDQGYNSSNTQSSGTDNYGGRQNQTDINDPNYGTNANYAGSTGIGSTGVPGNTTSADNWDNNNQSGQGFGQGQGQGQGQNRDRDQSGQGDNYASNQSAKPSVGERVMGGLEKAAGKVTRNEGMQDRGQERKEGATGLGDY